MILYKKMTAIVCHIPKNNGRGSIHRIAFTLDNHVWAIHQIGVDIFCNRSMLIVENHFLLCHTTL